MAGASPTDTGPELVPMIVLRESGWHYRGQGYGQGQLAWVVAASLAAAAAANPPMGRLATDEEVRQLAPDGPPAQSAAQAASPFAEPDSAVSTVLSATPAAQKLAEESEFDLTPWAGRGTGEEGRITASDVRAWIEQRDLKS